MAMQTPSGLTKHRLGQAEKMIERVTDGFHENVKRAFHDLREQLKGTSNQLYVQAVCSFELLYKTVQHATLYYAQRCPKELDEFISAVPLVLRLPTTEDRPVTPVV
jgi:hypothetical protein